MGSARDGAEQRLRARRSVGEGDSRPRLSSARLPASARLLAHRRADARLRARSRDRAVGAIRDRRRRDALSHVARPAAVLERIAFLSRVPAVAAEHQRASSSLNARLDPRPRPALALFLAFSCVVASAPSAAAQEPDTILPHADDARWWVSGQANPVVQGHGDFRSPYEGEHSLRPTHEHAISRLVTIYTRLRLGSGTCVNLAMPSAAR